MKDLKMEEGLDAVVRTELQRLLGELDTGSQITNQALIEAIRGVVEQQNPRDPIVYDCGSAPEAFENASKFIHEALRGRIG